jgi:hypothetical protein
MYDKWSVLRIETVINNPRDFKILRFMTDRRGRRRARWMRMGKGVKNLWRYLQVGEAANRRYLEALSQVQPTGKAVRELDGLCQNRVVNGRRYGKLNPWPPMTATCSAPSWPVNRRSLASVTATSKLTCSRPRPRPFKEAQRRCARTSRLIAKLRGHGLLAKVPGSRRYRVTSRGLRVMSATLRFRQAEFPRAMAA